MWIPLLRASILQGLLQNVVKCSLHGCWRAILLEALFNIPNTFPFTPSYAQKIDKEDPQIIKKVSLWRGANARNEDTNYWRAKLREALFNIPNTSPFTPSYVQKIGKKDPQMII